METNGGSSDPHPTTASEVCQHHIDTIEDQLGVGPTTVANLRAAVLELLYMTRNADARARAEREEPVWLERDSDGVLTSGIARLSSRYGQTAPDTRTRRRRGTDGKS